MININNEGWLENTQHMPSPFYDQRPSDAIIDLLVIHGISLPADEFGGGFIDDLFLGCLDSTAHPSFSVLEGLKVSAHTCIFRDGTIKQYVSFLNRAWHAGRSSYQGKIECNDYGIGIELEGCEKYPYTDAQYTSLLALTHSIQKAYPKINNNRIVGHCDVAPERKQDPWQSFDWQRFLSSL